MTNVLPEAPPELEPQQRELQKLPNPGLLKVVTFVSEDDLEIETFNRLLLKIVEYMNQDGGTLSIDADELLKDNNTNLLVVKSNQAVVKQHLINSVGKYIGIEYINLLKIKFDEKTDKLRLIIKVKKSPNPVRLKSLPNNSPFAIRSKIVN